MRDLVVQGGNAGGVDDNAKAAIQTEVDQLNLELDRIADTTQFNGQKLLDGTYTAANGTFQVGANGGETISITTITGQDSTTLGTDGVTITQGAVYDPSADLTAIDAAIKSVSTTRGDLGAVQNRLDHTVKNLNVAVENLSASESRIRDTDMASEMVSFTRAQILSQAGTAMLAQANQIPQGVLQLLR
jgi:flagellin